MALAVIELVLFGGAAGMDTGLQRVYAVTVQAPWLIPYDDAFWWMVPTSVAVLTVPFCAMSVALEYVVVSPWSRTCPAASSGRGW